MGNGGLREGAENAQRCGAVRLRPRRERWFQGRQQGLTHGSNNQVSAASQQILYLQPHMTTPHVTTPASLTGLHALP